MRTIEPPPEGPGIPWDELPGKVKQWVMENPGHAGVIVVGGMVFFYPSLISGPLLSLLGFTPSGPLAGSVAATIQSMIGKIPAGGVFACFQSAGMGGYGAAVVKTGVTMVAGGMTLAAILTPKFFRREQSSTILGLQAFEPFSRGIWRGMNSNLHVPIPDRGSSEVDVHTLNIKYEIERV